MPAPALVLRDGDREVLEGWARATSVRAGVALRSKVILAAADGVANAEIARSLGTSVPTVLKWRGRYEQFGLDGLDDRSRPGRPLVVDHAKVIAATLKAPPKNSGLTHWSSRELARRLRIGNATVARIWREYGITPWRTSGFRFSTDPELEAKVIDVVGLYLDPPENAIVLCIDEKSQIQALERAAPILPMRPGLPEGRSHDYIRHGTATLFAALDTATGEVDSRIEDHHRSTEFLQFCRQLARAHPDIDLHFVMDNYATHKSKDFQAWLARNPRIKVHYTPTHASWMNMVEIFFGIAERQAIRRGSFTSATQLKQAIRRFITAYNKTAKPFKWIKTSDDILAKAVPKTTSDTRH
ncbi:MAG: IS630 family transposase [Mycobacterium sp.]